MLALAPRRGRAPAGRHADARRCRRCRRRGVRPAAAAFALLRAPRAAPARHGLPGAPTRPALRCQRRASEDAALSVFSSFHAFNLTSYARVLWVELDQLVLRPLEPLWRLPLPATAAAAARGADRGLRDRVRGRGAGREPVARAQVQHGRRAPRANRTDFAALLEAMHARSYTCTDGFQTLWNRVLARRTVCVHHTYNCIEHQRAAFAPRCLLPNALTPRRALCRSEQAVAAAAAAAGPSASERWPRAVAPVPIQPLIAATARAP